MKKLLISIAILLVIATGCAPNSKVSPKVRVGDSTIQLDLPGPNPEVNKRAEDGQVAGAVQGLWHGLIAPVTAVGAFFDPTMQMYEVHNNGREYNLGFLIGVALIFLILGVIGGSGRRR